MDEPIARGNADPRHYLSTAAGSRRHLSPGRAVGGLEGGGRLDSDTLEPRDVKRETLTNC